MGKYFVYIFLFCFGSKFCFAQTYEWAKQLGDSNYDLGLSVAVDGSGNVYSTGYFQGTADFDPGLGTAYLTSAGSYDVFISKLDASGNFVWAKQMGGTSLDQTYAIVVDAFGNVYTTGTFMGTADFDPGLGTADLNSFSSTDVFVSKLDASGNFVWAKQLGGLGQDTGHYIAVDASGNVYTTGEFLVTADFDPGVGTANLTSAGNKDIFISKLDASGNFVWVKQFGGASPDLALCNAVDASGNIYTTGWFEGTVDFDPGVGIANLSSFGNADIYVSKLDASGNFVWAKRFGSISDDLGYSITLDASGNVYTTGHFLLTADFDPGIGTANLTSAGSYDIFISKLDATGNFVWAKQFGGTSSDNSMSNAVDASGNIYTTGYFQGTADFDPGVGTDNLTSAGDTDIFISKLDASGNLVWTKQIGAANGDKANCIVVGATGNIYTTGEFYLTVDFDTEAGVDNLTSVGNSDIFVHKISQCVNTAGTDVITACDSYTWIDGNTYTVSNNTATHILTNVAGCDSVVTLDLTIYSVSDVSTSINGITITANNGSAAYQWLDCNNSYTAITGVTNQAFTALTTGFYAVAITENGCIDTSTCVVITATDFYNEPGYQPLLAEVFPLPVSTMSDCNAEAFAFVTGGVSPYTSVWSNDATPDGPFYTDSICYGFYDFKVYDNIGDSVTVPFYITDSINYYNWYDPGIVVDTLYMNIENCMIDYGLPIDSINLVSLIYYGPNLFGPGDEYIAEMIYYQSGIAYSNQDTLVVTTPGAQLIMFAIWCPSKTTSTIKIINFSFDFPDALYLGIADNKVVPLIYPNPANDLIYVEGLVFDKFVIEDLSGRRVVGKNGYSATIDVSSLSTGIYLIRFFGNNQPVHTEKISVTR